MIIFLADDPLKPLIDKAIPISGLFVLALAVAVFFLWRSMNKQVRRINPDLPEGAADLQRDADAEYTAQAVERGEQQD